MTEHLLLGLSAIIALGIGAQWLAWRLKLPSILLLLIFGILAGSVFSLFNPDEMFGELLFPLVSVSVAIILFQGGPLASLFRHPWRRKNCWQSYYLRYPYYMGFNCIFRILHYQFILAAINSAWRNSGCLGTDCDYPASQTGAAGRKGWFHC